MQKSGKRLKKEEGNKVCCSSNPSQSLRDSISLTLGQLRNSRSEERNSFAQPPSASLNYTSRGFRKRETAAGPRVFASEKHSVHRRRSAPAPKGELCFEHELFHIRNIGSKEFIVFC